VVYIYRDNSSNSLCRLLFPYFPYSNLDFLVRIVHVAMPVEPFFADDPFAGDWKDLGGGGGGGAEAATSSLDHRPTGPSFQEGGIGVFEVERPHQNSSLDGKFDFSGSGAGASASQADGVGAFPSETEGEEQRVSRNGPNYGDATSDSDPFGLGEESHKKRKKKKKHKGELGTVAELETNESWPGASDHHSPSIAEGPFSHAELGIADVAADARRKPAVQTSVEQRRFSFSLTDLPDAPWAERAARQPACQIFGESGLGALARGSSSSSSSHPAMNSGFRNIWNPLDIVKWHWGGPSASGSSSERSHPYVEEEIPYYPRLLESVTAQQNPSYSYLSTTSKSEGRARSPLEEELMWRELRSRELRARIAELEATEARAVGGLSFCENALPPESSATHLVRITVPSPLSGDRMLGILVQDLVVYSVDDPRARQLGWQEGDRVLRLNENVLRSDQHLADALASALRVHRASAAPLIFEVFRGRPSSVVDRDWQGYLQSQNQSQVRHGTPYLHSSLHRQQALQQQQQQQQPQSLVQTCGAEDCCTLFCCGPSDKSATSPRENDELRFSEANLNGPFVKGSVWPMPPDALNFTPASPGRNLAPRFAAQQQHQQRQQQVNV